MSAAHWRASARAARSSTTLSNGAVSADGRYVVFSSAATDLLNGVNSKDQIVRRDLSTNKSALVSVATNGSAVGNGTSFAPIVSGDGRLVAFNSAASNLNAS